MNKTPPPIPPVPVNNGERETSPPTPPVSSSSHRYEDLIYVRSQAHSLREITQRSSLQVRVLENHPMDKAVAQLPPLKEMFLPFGIGDNNLFKITRAGKLVFRKPPDYERPTDTGNQGHKPGDGDYHLSLLGVDESGRLVRLPVVVTVLDLPQEKTGPNNPRDMYKFTTYSGASRKPSESRHDDDHHSGSEISDLLARYPKAEVAKIVWGQHWVMPASGPLMLTWSLKVRSTIGVLHVSDHVVQEMRMLVERALLKFEGVVDIRFVEVDEFGGKSGHINFFVTTGGTHGLGHAAGTLRLGSANAPGRQVQVNVYDSDSLATIIHEIGHALGLKHPFSSGLKHEFTNGRINWPYDPAVRREPWSIMNYEHNLQDLTPFDIAALQYLYGAPGTNSGIGRVLRPTGQEVQSPTNLRPTAFTISESAKTLLPGMYDDLVLAVISVTDDGLGTAIPIVVKNGSKFDSNLLLERQHDFWQLKYNGNLSVLTEETQSFTIRLLANGSGPNTTPDLTFALTVRPANAGTPITISVDTGHGGRSTLREDQDTSRRLKIAKLLAEDVLNRPLEGIDFIISGDDASLFEIVDSILYLRAGARLDHGTNPQLDIVIGVVGSELRKSFAIPVDGVFGPNEPVVTGERKVGAQLAVSTDHNSWIVVESIEWRRQGEGDVLSTIELFRAESPGNYQVTMTYWVRTIVAEYKPPSKTWTETISIAPIESAAIAKASRNVQNHELDLLDSYSPNQNEEVVDAPLYDIV